MLYNAFSYIHLQFEPIFDSKENLNYLQHIILYECQGGYSYKLEVMASEIGRQCQSQNMPCNAIVAAWYRGSEVCKILSLL